MTDQPADAPTVYQSIVDCAICACIPQVFMHDTCSDYPHIIPPEAQGKPPADGGRKKGGSRAMLV